MFEKLLKVRYAAVIIVVLSVLHAFAFLAMGAKVALHAYAQIVSPDEEVRQRPGLELLHSLDFMFVSLVLLVLGLGIAKLFLVMPGKEPADLPKWLHIENISQLKVLLWETVLTTLLIVAMSDLVTNLGKPLEWTVLIAPGAILLLALSLYFMKKH
jgi:uncharacterized membrane protein YqhA